MKRPIKAPGFTKQPESRARQIKGIVKRIASEKGVQKGVEVTVDYQGVTVSIKVIEKVSEKSFTGTIIRFSEYTSPSGFEDLSIGDAVEFFEDQIIILDPKCTDV